jgi:hypothetical protein
MRKIIWNELYQQLMNEEGNLSFLKVFVLASGVLGFLSVLYAIYQFGYMSGFQECKDLVAS